MAKRQITRNDDDDGDDDDDYDDDVDDHDDDSYSHHVSIFCSAMKLLNEGANPNCVVFLRLMCAAIEIFPKVGRGVSRVPKTH